MAAGGETPADLVQRLVGAAFPELTGPQVTYRWNFSPLLVDVFREDGKDRQAATSHAVLRAEVVYSADRRLHSVAFGGEMVNEAQNRRLYDTLAEHHDWSRDDLARWLAADGAQYGPDRERQLRAALQVERFRDVFGPLSVAYVGFSWRFDHPEAGAANIRPPVWRVALRPRSRSQFRCYILLLEPYHGRVSAVMPSPDVCRPVND